MFGSEVLDVAIGLVFIYLVLSLISSAACELIESFLKRRSLYLLEGLQELLNDPAGTGLVKELYQHPLVSSLFRGKYQPGETRNLPSYIPARIFSLALMDIIGPGGQGQPPGERSGAANSTAAVPPMVPYPGAASPGSAGLSPSVEWLRNAVLSNLKANPQTAQALLTLTDAAGADPVKIRENIEDWYNSVMDRVSGWFKRTSHKTILVVGLLLSLAINADTISITNSLATDKSVRASLVTAAAEAVKPAPATQNPPAAAGAQAAAPVPTVADEFTRSIPACQVDLTSAECRFASNLRQIRNVGLPLGWASVSASPADDARRIPQSLQDWLIKLLGLSLTTLAISLGAPFWFDTLNRIIVVRSTVKPIEKSPEEPAKS